MPAEVAYAEVVRASLVLLQPNGDVAINVMHFQVGAGADIDQAWASDLGGQIDSAHVNSMRPIVSNQVKLDHITVQDLRSTPYPTFIVAEGEFGQAAGELLPSQMAAVISLHTAHPGRSGRGRMFMGGLTESANAATGVIGDAAIASMVEYASTLAGIALVGTDEVALGVLSRKNAALYPVTAWTVDNRWDVQRRRANRRVF